MVRQGGKADTQGGVTEEGNMMLLFFIKGANLVKTDKKTHRPVRGGYSAVDPGYLSMPKESCKAGWY